MQRPQSPSIKQIFTCKKDLIACVKSQDIDSRMNKDQKRRTNDKSEINPEASRPKPPERKVDRQSQKPHDISETIEETVGVESRPHHRKSPCARV
ncbi:hypothetical protein Bca4012_090747 [Brassica carinata]|uniref:Uncharacterized protein n=1 Tax=Brassica carinata TaxID=52824 RepID=A0A8X7TM79_BRACI|nr:hypothetical protein Bca52824_085899 [Brassica carinata]